MIKCSVCQETKDDTFFAWKIKAKGQRQSKCRECHKQYVAKHYKDNKSLYVKRALQNTVRTYERNKKFLAELKSKFYCERCGENHPAVLDFHHRNSDEKEFTVANFGCKSIKKLEVEIDKCIVLCSNCHRKLHWEERQLSSPTRGTN